MALDLDEIRKPIKKLRKLLKDFPRTPEPEQVHEVRTRSRRLEAAFHALSLDDSEDKLLKLVGKVRKQAGKVRDMDVLTASLAKLPTDGQSEHAVQLLEFLGVERYKQAGKLHGVVKQHGSELRDRLKKCQSRVQSAVAPKQDGSADGTHAAAAGRILQLAKQVAERPARLNARNLHDYRKQIKQLQYMLDMADAHSRDEVLIEKLKAVKDAIGEWHDWQVLTEIAVDVLGDDKNAFVKKLQQIVKEKYDRGLELAIEVREQHLKPALPKAPATNGSKKKSASIGATAASVAVA